jgi:flagellar biosynthesis GTPase FlhF
MGTGVVWRLDVPLETVIEPEDLEPMCPKVEPGDMVLLDTGAAGRSARSPGTASSSCSCR